MAIPEAPANAGHVREEPFALDGAGLHVHPAWSAAWPWLTQGTTSGADMSLFGGSPTGEVLSRWWRLRTSLGYPSVVHARQVHRADVLVHDDVPQGLLIAGDADGHASGTRGVLLTVSVADCVPIFVVAPAQRAVALLHGGWRGVAAGILEQGIDQLRRAVDASTAELRVHMGPAICGDCFEVGSEVVDALDISGSAEYPADRYRVDLRAHLAHAALRLGVQPQHVTSSAYCTRCGDSPFFSHRGGCAERQIAVLGIRADGP